MPSRNFLIVWNVLGLGFLLTIVGIAILSAPLPFQQLAFEQPNIAVLRFPYVLLPGIVVPLVGLSHLLHLKQLLTQPDPQATPILSETVDS